ESLNRSGDNWLACWPSKPLVRVQIWSPGPSTVSSEVEQSFGARRFGGSLPPQCIRSIAPIKSRCKARTLQRDFLVLGRDSVVGYERRMGDRHSLREVRLQCFRIFADLTQRVWSIT